MGKVKYMVITEWDPEEELYVATIPALSVGSYGAIPQDALDKITEAAEVTIEGFGRQGNPCRPEMKINLVTSRCLSSAVTSQFGASSFPAGTVWRG